MLKITTVQEDPSLRVNLCGKFTAEYIPAVQDAIAPDPHAKLDLTNVTFVDRDSMVFLCGARSKGIAIENIPSYVIRWIEQEGRCGPPPKE